VRLKDEKSLVIINPTSFSKEMQEKINSMGTVVAMITPVASHGVALSRCHDSIWPEAKLYGTDIQFKHDEPQLPWTGFFTPRGYIDCENVQNKEPPKELVDEFSPIPLTGHIFGETAFYHKPTKSLLGITDMMVCKPENPPDNIPWLFEAYGFALGMHRPDLNSPIATQSYHIMFCTDQRRLQSSIKQLMSHDIQHVVFGHGGIIHGKENCENALNLGFRWATNHTPSIVESVISKILWAKTFGLPF